MEDKKLEGLFKRTILELEKKGYSPLVIRESFDHIAPKLPWQSNWFILPIIAAAMLVGLLLPPVIVLAGLFLAPNQGFLAAGILLGSAGFLYYFALSAFNIHEGVKLIFTIVMSLAIGAITFLSHMAAVILVDKFLERTAEFSGLASLPGAPAALGTITAFEPRLLSVVQLLVIVFLAYNLWPFLFWVKERIQLKKKATLDRK